MPNNLRKIIPFGLFLVSIALIAIGLAIRTVDESSNFQVSISVPETTIQEAYPDYQVTFKNSGSQPITIYGLKFLCFPDGCVDFHQSDQLDRLILKPGETRTIAATVTFRADPKTPVIYPVYFAVPGGKMLRHDVIFRTTSEDRATESRNSATQPRYCSVAGTGGSSLTAKV